MISPNVKENNIIQTEDNINVIIQPDNNIYVIIQPDDNSKKRRILSSSQMISSMLSSTR
jgi:hypothetical protein